MNLKQITQGSALAAILAISGGALAHEKPKGGYLIDSQGHVVVNNFGQCWRTGSWTPAMAIAECDPDLVKKEAPKAAAPAAAPAAPMAGPDKPAFQKITIKAETLFDFDKSVVRDAGKSTLNDEVVAKMKAHPQVEVVLVTGHTDQIGTAKYNQKLSERRANAVKAYLVSQGILESRIETAAKGESEPVKSVKDCKGQRGKNLIACLQPNRRVVVEIKVQAQSRK